MADKSDNVERIKWLLKSGKTPKEIADEMQVSLRRVYQVRGETPREPMTPAKAVEIRAALMAGRSQADIAGQFKVSRKTVAKIKLELPAATRAKVMPSAPKPQGRVSADDVAHILSRSKAGRSVGTIAKELQIGESAVRQVLKRHPRASVRAGDSIMAAIVAEMERRGLSAHGLAELVPAPPTREHLYDCLNGTAVPGTPVASRILAALGLAVRKLE